MEFLVGNAAEIGFNRYTILNLHAILANNLLADERAAGRLRHIGVDRAAFREVAENELLGLHEGNFARYPIRPREFAAWQEIWDPRGR